MRILHLRQSCGLYGADRALLDLACATPRGWTPVVGAIARPAQENPFADEARRRGLPLWVLESRGRADTQIVRQLARRLVDEQVSLVHAHDYKSLCIGALAAAHSGIPVVATWHGDTSATLPLKLYEGLARVVGNATRGVAAVSSSLAERLRLWIHAAKVHHIPNGIAAPPPLSDGERAQAREAYGLGEGPVVAIIGRLSPEKGHALLFRALRTLPHPPTVLMAGTGPLEASLREQARGLDVRFLGFLPDPRRVYAACDLVVMPSATEGLPLVALEAMSLGCPVVASSVGELPVLLSAGAGHLVPPGDEAALASALRRCLESPALRAVMSERAKAKVREGYGLARMAARYADELWWPALRTTHALTGRRREALVP
jgi:glycosyltransferase involved in cell wall biosynthesis